MILSVSVSLPPKKKKKKAQNPNAAVHSKTAEKLLVSVYLKRAENSNASLCSEKQKPRMF